MPTTASTSRRSSPVARCSPLLEREPLLDLKHTFTVPAGIDETWSHFQDIESVAGCFPGATVTEIDGDDFKGSAKVKLGPIALVYNGTGHFVEKDEAAHKFVLE